MTKVEARLKEEYGGLLVNARKAGEAIMVGDDVAVMVTRVIGNTVRIGVASKSGQYILREEKYRQIKADRANNGPAEFVPFYRHLVKGKDVVAYYSMQPNEQFNSEIINGPEDADERDDSVTVIKWGRNKHEAEACVLGVTISNSEDTATAEVVDRDWYVIVRHLGAANDGLPKFKFLDNSFPWEEYNAAIVNEDNLQRPGRSPGNR